ncbi:MAG: single-stranded DNA-binding protein [Bryobacteraceae bacterium]
MSAVSCRHRPHCSYVTAVLHLPPSRPGHLLRFKPRARLSSRSALSVPPAGFSTSENLGGAGTSNKALQLVWERGRSLSGCPRNNGRQTRRTYMYTMNQLTIIGFTGNDAESHYTPNGTLVTTLSVATKESWKDADGQWKSRTDWHRAVSFESGPQNQDQFSPAISLGPTRSVDFVKGRR